MTTQTIDLELLTKGEVHNLSGHDRGVAARKMFELDGLDQSTDDVRILVPDYVYGVSPSFVQGLLAETVHRLGDSRDRFYSRFSLAASDLVKRQFERGLSAILTNRTEPVI